MNARRRAAMEIISVRGNVSQFESGRFRVQSQSDPGKSYVVWRTGSGMACECADHRVRKADCKHIQAALEFSRKNRGYKNEGFRIIERSKMGLCRYCDSGRVKKSGFRRNRHGRVARLTCLDCGRRFSDNAGFGRMRSGAGTITAALQMYYSGMSCRDIARLYAMQGGGPSHATVYGWVAKYSRMVAGYLDGVVPRTRSRVMVRADEKWLRVAGEQMYLFASMEDDTRYWLAAEMADTKFQHNADSLLGATMRAIGRRPAHLVTDGLPAYAKSSRRVFGRKTWHHAHVHLRGDMNNNRMERLNGEIRDRVVVFRGLKRRDAALVGGMMAYYNYSKGHGGLGGITPAEAALITVEGDDKWRTLIQNASLGAGRGV